MQFRVPQNISMEDRIVGPLTALQFGILVIGGSSSFFIYQSLPGIIGKFLGVVAALFTVAIALGKFNDQPLHTFFRFLIAYVTTPRMRIWHKSGTEGSLIRASHSTAHKEDHRVKKNISRQDIANLAVVLDSRGNTGLPPRITSPEPPEHE